MSDDPLFDRLAQALAGRYTLVRELGRGGMATVYLATDVKLGRHVAIKVLPPTTRAYLGSGRFQREVLFAAQLSHPHIVPLFEADEADGLLFYVMEYVEGESLQDRLARDGPLAVEEAVRIAAEVGDALEYAHETGVIHRDIKPGNILLSRGHAMVSDFGIAKLFAESGTTAGGSSITGTGITVGTAEYMSPEQASGEKRIDARSDVYGLAAVLYEMLAGEPPFTGPSAQAIVARVLSEFPRPIHTIRPNLPAHIERTLAAGLAKLAADRPPTARHFVEMLTRPTAERRWAARPRWQFAALAALVLGGAAVALGVAGRHGPGAGGGLLGEWRSRAAGDDRYARLLLYRLDGSDGRRVHALPPRQPHTGAVGASATGDVARDGRALDGGASVLSVARPGGSAANGSGVGGGGGGPEWDRLPVGERLGARARQRGRGDRHAQAGRFFPARAFP